MLWTADIMETVEIKSWSFCPWKTSFTKLWQVLETFTTALCWWKSNRPSNWWSLLTVSKCKCVDTCHKCFISEIAFVAVQNLHLQQGSREVEMTQQINSFANRTSKEILSIRTASIRKTGVERCNRGMTIRRTCTLVSNDLGRKSPTCSSKGGHLSPFQSEHWS
jgi:hypothetical protein